MKAFANRNARTLEEAIAVAREVLEDGRAVSFAAGGTDLLQLVKDRIVNRPSLGQPGSDAPDVLVNLKTVDGLNRVTSREGGTARAAEGGVVIGGLITLAALSRHPLIPYALT